MLLEILHNVRKYIYFLILDYIYNYNIKMTTEVKKSIKWRERDANIRYFCWKNKALFTKTSHSKTGKEI